SPPRAVHRPPRRPPLLRQRRSCRHRGCRVEAPSSRRPAHHPEHVEFEVARTVARDDSPLRSVLEWSRFSPLALPVLSMQTSPNPFKVRGGRLAYDWLTRPLPLKGGRS